MNSFQSARRVNFMLHRAYSYNQYINQQMHLIKYVKYSVFHNILRDYKHVRV
jgi:hypothetical protein